jgi:hypothetical protein
MISCQTLHRGGWRLPTLPGLQTIYQPGAGPRNMDPIFQATGWLVWPVQRDASSTWFFSFHDGEEC